MKINFYATLRPITGQKTVEFDLCEDITVGQMVDQVIDRYPKMAEELLNANGELSGHVHVFINGRDSPYLDDRLATVIKVSDKIDIFPAVGGG